ncbi:MAG: DUF1553 domain-containing protein [Planctomycetota bacterium]|nr:DUF1553 domain-containing protein [Planctomycetota bacterium]
MRHALAVTLITAISLGQEAPSFNRDVRPILADRCFPCHGPDEGARKAKLRLDVRDQAVRTRRSGSAAFVPHDVQGSLAVLRMRSDDPKRHMPPPSSKLVLTEDEIRTLERWIAAGAPYERHWAFVTPKAHPTPSIADGIWARDPMDAFVLRRLEESGLRPSPDADAETLIRRVTFDLTGLPPTANEIDAFVADQRPDAYEHLVDRLLQSPHYGERMATNWLDAARYADTFGYQSDVYREVWPWRDWVIRAFNENLPYDKFVTWQIAGDMLPDATRDQRLATAFNRLHRQTNEGGSVEEEYRQEYIGDRVHTMGTAFLGLTLECARCHDHKFDPISQAEYYGLAAFFANIDESGLYSHFTNATPTPALRLPNQGQEKTLADLDKKIADATTARDALREKLRGGSAKAETSDVPDRAGWFSFEKFETGGAVANAADPKKPGKTSEGPKIIEGAKGNGLLLSGENNAWFPGLGAFTRHDPFTFSLWVRTPDRKGRSVILHRTRAWTDAGSQGYELLIMDGALQWSLIHFWPGDAVSIRTRQELPVGRWVHLAVSHDGSARAAGLHVWMDGEPAGVVVIKDKLTRSIMGGGPQLTIGQRFRDKGFKGGAIDEFQVFSRALCDAEVAHLHDGGAHALSPEGVLSAANPEWREAAAKLTALRKQRARHIDSIRTIMAMEEMADPRPTHILDRGRYDAPGERASPATPSAIMAMVEDLPRNRLGLARWLTDPKNPLIARVAVNRLWQLAFGHGLVGSAENMGTQGTPPTHPKLLDRLATDLVHSGWDVKAMLRRIVTSSTYRQTSRGRPDGMTKDTANENLWRAPSRRLTAEMLRDQALVVSGLLATKIGGPPVKPYQPPGLWKEKSGKTYARDKGAGLYRRSLYTIWKRTSPPPSMMILDSAKRDICVVQRHETNTPLQSLLLFNDPQFVEAARVLAAQALKEKDPVGFAFRALTSRHPRAPERAALDALLAAERERYGKDPKAADALLKTGDAALPKDADKAELAAMGLVCSTIMNSDAAVTRR